MSFMKARNTAGRFFKRNRTAQTAYDMAMSHLMPTMEGSGLYIGRGGLHSGKGMYTGPGLYTGEGEYQANTNHLIQSKSSMDVVPQFVAETDDGVTFSKREYVSEIYGPRAGVPFQVQSFAINPGLEATFPWLSQVAQNYDEYDMHQCIFTFKSTTTESSNSDNGQVGTVIMTTNYNAAAANFQDKAEMQRYEGACSARLTETLLHGVECDPDKLSGSRGNYIRNNPVVVGQDLKTYDHGKFQIAVANASSVYADVSLGELWVTYTVTLRKSKFYTALGLGITKDIFVSNGGEVLNITNSISIMGTDILKGQQNNLGCLLTQVTKGVQITFPASFRGYLKILLAMEGTGYVTTGGDPITARTGNVSYITDLYGGRTSQAAGEDKPSTFLYTSGVDGNSLMWLLHIKVDIATGGINNTVTLTTALATATTLTQTYIDISEYNSGFSGKALNINQSDAPIWVNSSNVVTPVN